MFDFDPRNRLVVGLTSSPEYKINAHSADCRVIVVAIRKRGVIQTQKDDRAVDEAAADSSHIVQPRARKFYAPVGRRKRNNSCIFSPATNDTQQSKQKGGLSEGGRGIR